MEGVKRILVNNYQNNDIMSVNNAQEEGNAGPKSTSDVKAPEVPPVTNEDELCEIIDEGNDCPPDGEWESADDFEREPIDFDKIHVPNPVSTPKEQAGSASDEHPVSTPQEQPVSTPSKGIKKEDALREQSKDFAKQIYDDIHAKKFGLFDGTSDELYQNIMDNVTPENAKLVLKYYSDSHDDSAQLIDDIFKEGTLNKKEKGELIKHIVGCRLEAAGDKNIQTDDLQKRLDEAVDKETGKIFRAADSSEIANILQEIETREENAAKPPEALGKTLDEED